MINNIKRHIRKLRLRALERHLAWLRAERTGFDQAIHDYERKRDRLLDVDTLVFKPRTVVIAKKEVTYKTAPRDYAAGA